MQLKTVFPNQWNRVRENFQRLNSSLGLGPQSSPTYAGLILTGLTASRLVAVDIDTKLESTNIASWIAGTSNQISITDDGDGTATLSTPQDIHIDATPEWAGTTIKDSGDNIIFYVDDDELYFTAAPTDPVTGNPMPWLFYFTYTI